MRAVILAAAIAGLAGAASAQGSTSVWGGEVRESLTPTVPAGARQQAEDAVRRDFRDPDTLTFRAVRASEVASVRHGGPAPAIDGPISIVCGQYTSPEMKGDYSWFFVAIKQGRVLWTASDATSGTPDEAYYSCQGAGLTHEDAATGTWH